MSKNGNLTITRASGETLIITTEFGEQIEVLLHAFQGKQCKISVSASKSVRIVRGELLEQNESEIDRT